MSDQSKHAHISEVKTLDVLGCRGFEAGRCRFAMPLTEKHALSETVGSSAADGPAEADGPFDMVAAVRASLETTGWDAFLREKMQGALRHHHSFKVALSACPNGCSRPHVADIGIIRAVMPSAPNEHCNACGLCINLCPDKALRAASVEDCAKDCAKDCVGHGMLKGSPILDASKCMACGLCVRRCPERALGRLDCTAQCDDAPQADGWRILLGGCLGRHPRLATQLAGIHDSATVCAVVSKALSWYMEDFAEAHKRGQTSRRFARLVESDAEEGAFLLGERDA